MAISPKDFMEIGLIVPDLEKTMAQLGQAFGYTFTDELSGALPMRGPEGDSAPDFRTVYSVQEPHLELIEARPGTALRAPEGTSLHHLGVWVDDLAAESARLVELGLPMVRAGVVDGESPAMWAYHELADGTLIELVSREQQPMFRQLIDEGTVPAFHGVSPGSGSGPDSAE